MHLLHELVVGKFGKDDLVVGHFHRAPAGVATAARKAQIFAFIPNLPKRHASIADLRLPAKGKRPANLAGFLVDFATGVGAGGPFRIGCMATIRQEAAIRGRNGSGPSFRPGEIQGRTIMSEHAAVDQEASNARRGRGASGGAAARRAARSGGGPGTVSSPTSSARSTSTRCSTRKAWR